MKHHDTSGRHRVKKQDTKNPTGKKSLVLDQQTETKHFISGMSKCFISIKNVSILTFDPSLGQNQTLKYQNFA